MILADNLPLLLRNLRKSPVLTRNFITCRNCCHYRAFPNFTPFRALSSSNSCRTRHFRIFASTRDLNVFKKEYGAVRTLFHKSGLPYGDQLKLLTRGLKTSSSKFQQSSGKDGKNDKNKDEDNEKVSSLIAKAFLWMLTAYMIVATLSLILPNSDQPEFVRYIAWNEFVHHMLAKGEVEQIIVRPDLEMVTIILHENAIIKGRRAEHNAYHMNIVDINKFEDKLRAAEKSLGIIAGGGVPIVYERGSDTAGKILASIIIACVLISLIIRSKTIRSPLSMDRLSQLTRAKFTLIDPHSGEGRGVKFQDVAGLKEVKQEVMEVVDYLKRPEHYRMLGAKVPRGVLLLGPPGCGKTLLAKAVATEAKLPFLSMNGSEFVEMIGGLGAARVRDLFKEGRKRAPCIIYIDEIDAIGRKRSQASGPIEGTAGGEGEQTLNQLLVEMDGMQSKEGVLMLASTNRADVLDKALLRPGRFDRHILIDLPTVEERAEIFQHHMKGVALEGSAETYAKRLAHLTPGFSGADIANVVNEAALHAARSLKAKVQKEDLEYAVERVVGGTEKRSHSMSAEEKRVVAFHESGHALIGWLLPHTEVLLKVSIVPRTNLALGFAQYTPTNQKLFSKEELEAKICMALGGRVAEAIVFGRVTTGAENDLKKVTNIATSMVRVFGMNKSVGLVSFPKQEEETVKPFSKQLGNLIDMEAQKIVSKAYKETEKVLIENRDKLEKIAESLLAKETLNYDDVVELIGPPLHGNKKKILPSDFEALLKEMAPESEPRPTEDPKQGDERESTPTFSTVP